MFALVFGEGFAGLTVDAATYRRAL